VPAAGLRLSTRSELARRGHRAYTAGDMLTGGGGGGGGGGLGCRARARASYGASARGWGHSTRRSPYVTPWGPIRPYVTPWA
jgi:hypothetical protein